MQIDESEDKMLYRVIVNEERQYSVWPADRKPRAGWNYAGKTGTHRECIDYIKTVWEVLRPPHLQKKQ